MNNFKTYSIKAKDITHKWYLVNANGQVLGRLASQIAKILRGKHKPEFVPHLDVGDFVIVVNASKIRVTGNNKKFDKHYYSHSGYPGALKSINLNDLLNKSPEKLIQYAVKGMLPRNQIGRAQLKKLKIYADANHKHQAQKFEELKF